MTRAPEFYCATHMQEFRSAFSSDVDVIASTEDVHAKFRKPCAIENCEDDKTRRVRFAPAPEVEHDGSAVDGDVPLREAETVVQGEPSASPADAGSELEPGTRQAARMARKLMESQVSEETTPQVVAPEGEGGLVNP